jgi:hypothetical protein
MLIEDLPEGGRLNPTEPAAVLTDCAAAGIVRTGTSNETKVKSKRLTGGCLLPGEDDGNCDGVP